VAQLPEYLSATSLAADPVSREVVEAHQRERILQAVTPVFAKRGYQGTTVDDLLASGKVGVTNFYALFEGKEDCFLACFDRVVEIARDRIATAIASAPGWDGVTYLALREVVAMILAEPLSTRLVLIEAQSAGPAALARYNGLLDRAIDWLAKGREGRPQARRLPSGFEQAAISGLAFYLQQCLLDSHRHTTEELSAEVAGLVLEPILGAAELGRIAAAPVST
jgi:AcrR family transcriptional regulator